MCPKQNFHLLPPYSSVWGPYFIGGDLYHCKSQEFPLRNPALGSMVLLALSLGAL